MKLIILLAMVCCAVYVSGMITPEFFINYYDPDAISSSSTRCVVANISDPSMGYALDEMMVWDISNPAQPIQGYCYSFSFGYTNPTVSHNLLFYGKNNQICVDDITDIYTPANLVTIPSQYCYTFAVKSHYLFLGMQNGDIKVYDFNDPDNIHYEGSQNIMASIWRIWEFGDNIAVSCGWYSSPTIKVLDFNEQSCTFSLTASFELPCIETYVGKLGSNAIIRLENDSLFIYDSSILGNVYPVAEANLPDDVKSFVTDGTRLYTVNAQNCVQIWDMNDQYVFNCVTEYHFPETSNPTSKLFKVTGNYLTCYTYYHCIYWLNISDLQPSPYLVNQYSSGDVIKSVAYLDIGNGYLFSNYPEGLAVLEVNPDDSITHIAAYYAPGVISRLKMYRNYLYGLDESYEGACIMAYDFTNLSQPALMLQIPVVNVDSYFMQNDIIYVGTKSELDQYRIDNYGTPVYVDSLYFQFAYAGLNGLMEFNDATEYRANDYAVGRWESISNYSVYPFLVYKLNNGESGYIMQCQYFDKIYAHAGYLYTIGRGFQVYQLFDDAPPVLINVLYNSSIFSGASGITEYQDNYLIVSFSSSNSIAIFDISNPAQPVLIRKIQQPYPALSICVGQDKLYAANGTHGISIYELSNLTHNEEDISAPPQNDISAYPNPFTEQVRLAFELKQQETVIIKLYNCKGQLVRTIKQAGLKSGKHEILWDGKDNQNKSCAGGVYIAKLKTTINTSVKKIIKLK